MTKVEMRYMDKAFDITHDPKKVTTKALIKAVEDAGFDAKVKKEKKGRTAEPPKKKVTEKKPAGTTATLLVEGMT